MTDTIRTETDLLDNLFQDGQPAESITAQDMRDFIASTKFLNAIGWKFLFDAEYPDQNDTRNITDGSRTQLTIAPNVGEDLKYPSTFPDCWNRDNVADQYLQPFSLNGFGIVRLSLVAFPSSQNGRFDLEMNIGATGTENPIYIQTSTFAKGSGVSNQEHFNYIIPLFCGQDFFNNGGRFFITPTNTDIDIFQTTLTVATILYPNPAGEDTFPTP